MKTKTTSVNMAYTYKVEREEKKKILSSDGKIAYFFVEQVRELTVHCSTH